MCGRVTGICINLSQGFWPFFSSSLSVGANHGPAVIVAIPHSSMIGFVTEVGEPQQPKETGLRQKHHVASSDL